MIKFHVYAKPNCPACTATQTILRGKDAPVEISNDVALLKDKAEQYGCTVAPIVEVVEHSQAKGSVVLAHWSGMDVEKIRRWAMETKQESLRGRPS